MLLLSLTDFFSIQLFQKHFRDTICIRASNYLDPDQDGHSVCPDLDTKLFAKVISGPEESPLAGKGLCYYEFRI